MDVITLRSLPSEDIIRLRNSAKIADSLENKWNGRLERALNDVTRSYIKNLDKTGKVIEPSLIDVFCEHFFDVSIRAMRHAMGETEEHSSLPKSTGLALPKIRIPTSLKDLMRLYDLYRKGKFKPKRSVKQAREIQKQYLKKVSSVWERHSEDFRAGDVATQEMVVRKIREAAQTTTSRAKNIVRTETTNYYNKARKEFYDESDDITHYLFVAIRDAATSPWCSPLTTHGMRGRSGLVYAKSDPLCNKERPACHPGCRSEFLPLNRLNPAHLRFIQNLSIQRRENTCFPLLKGWKAA
jgi:SPP1 gp7 family putative phage head morphogenesis protein